MVTRRTVLRSAGSAAAALALPGSLARAQGSRAAPLTITTTTVMNSPNPYAHSAVDMYRIWSNVYGTLGRYDTVQKKNVGILAESWSRIDDTRWRFTLRKDIRRHDGGPGPTSRDVLHSWQRTLTDKASLQRFQWSEIAKLEAVDALTFDAVTKRPYAQILSSFFRIAAITSADLFAQHGADADRKAPHGWGPYALDRFDIDNRIVLRRSKYWPGARPGSPETAIFRQVIEPEQRVTALLNNEVQIARIISPQLLDRVRGRPDIKVVETSALEFMFLGMNASIPPFTDVRVRKAVAHAINRDLIIERLLFGKADKLPGAVLPDQECFGPAAGQAGYDPARSRALLAEAGYPDGLDVDFSTASGRYVMDRQVAEAIAQMLGAVGIRAKLHAPDYASFFASMARGKLPLFYAGRATSQEPVTALSQFFETSPTQRFGYTSPRLDAEFQKARSSFEQTERCAVTQVINDILANDVPAVPLWTHRSIHAIRRNVNWQADPTSEVWLPDVTIG